MKLRASNWFRPSLSLSSVWQIHSDWRSHFNFTSGQFLAEAGRAGDSLPSNQLQMVFAVVIFCFLMWKFYMPKEVFFIGTTMSALIMNHLNLSQSLYCNMILTNSRVTVWVSCLTFVVAGLCKRDGLRATSFENRKLDVTQGSMQRDALLRQSCRHFTFLSNMRNYREDISSYSWSL